VPRLRHHAVAAVAVLALAGVSPALAAPASDAVRAGVRAYREAHETAILDEFRAMLALPNVADDSAAIRRNADDLVARLARRGLAARRLESPGSPPAVYAERRVRGAKRTVMFYAHYDGQPVDPSQWTSGPWTPTLRDRPVEQGGREIAWPAAGEPVDPEARLYARSASDDKGPIMALLAGLDALADSRVALSVNLKIFLEGEEEQGSPHLREMLTQHRDLLAADLWIFCDGPMHASRKPQLVYGVRGTMGFEITVYGPTAAIHSGHYGNWAPNPAARLATLLADLRAPDGRVRAAGFYDAVRDPTAEERAAIAAIPSPDSSLAATYGIAASEGGDALTNLIMLPAFNVRGLAAGGVGDAAANAIPTEARASVDIRLVPDQQPAALRQSIEDHLRAQGWHVVHQAPTAAERRQHDRIVRLEWSDGYPALRTPLDLPAAQALARVVGEATGEPPLRAPTLGGSLPLYLFREVLDAPIIVLPVVNHDNRQHGPDENLRIRNLWDGIEILANVIARMGVVGW
jgi:acetylornithine deacetylase/succinyl-diaminopimelate desuccinylase-like protein